MCVGGSSHGRHRPQNCLGSRRSTSPFSLFHSGYVLVSVSQVCQRSDVAAPHNHCSENKLNCGCDRAEDKSVNSTCLSNSVSFLCHHPGRGALRSELLRPIQPVSVAVVPRSCSHSSIVTNIILNGAIIQYRVWHLILSWSTLSISTQKIKVQVK